MHIAMASSALLNTRFGACVVIGATLAFLSFNLIDDPLQARAVALASFCLVLWLGEAVPGFVPSLLLLGLIPLVLPGSTFQLSAVLGWMADPVLVLFFGGFTLGVAAQRYGIDATITSYAVRWSGGRRLRLLALVMGATACLSMWMSNTAAAAMMLAALRPMIGAIDRLDGFRAAMLVGIAVSANLGGMATPIGSPPNAIAVATLEHVQPISLVGWMIFGLPCMLVLLVLGLVLLIGRYRLRNGSLPIVQAEIVPIKGGRPWSVVVIFVGMVMCWLTEPLHGIPVPVVAALGAMVLFGSGLLSIVDLGRIDWATLILIAGGLALGRMLQETGAIASIASAIEWGGMLPSIRVALLVGVAAAMSAVMSNTATATMIIPLAYAIDPVPATPVLVALGCSLGMPFAISTPPNALVYGEGLKVSDLLIPGLVFMILGCVLIALAGPVLLGQ
jgi:solute carrier family 13 (sodium-dependent dicarboxylate transporter), member 2/3/5